MPRKVFLFCLLTIICSFYLLPAQTAAQKEVGGDLYLLAPGDVLNINFFGMPEISVPELAIRPDGKVAIPVAGEVEATGRTPEELAAEIVKALKIYYQDPIVTVNVTTFRSLRVYVVGQVNRPGSYELDKSHNLMDAIGAAQGWNSNALKTKVYIVRSGSKGEPMKVNLLDLLKKGDTSLNYKLGEGDIVFLTENNKVDLVQDIMSLVNPAYLLHHWEREP